MTQSRSVKKECASLIVLEGVLSMKQPCYEGYRWDDNSDEYFQWQQIQGGEQQSVSKLARQTMCSDRQRERDREGERERDLERDREWETESERKRERESEREEIERERESRRETERKRESKRIVLFSFISLHFLTFTLFSLQKVLNLSLPPSYRFCVWVRVYLSLCLSLSLPSIPVFFTLLSSLSISNASSFSLAKLVVLPWTCSPQSLPKRI